MGIKCGLTMKELNIYLKTTETCNLNCLHCFTSGTAGAKIYWDYKKTADWLQRLAKELPSNHVHFDFHGGEPFLVPVEQMEWVQDNTRGIWPSMSWGATTNLVYKLTDEKINFIKYNLENRVATSWDPDIRFANPKQYDLWRKNVDTLVNEGVTVKLFVSLTKGTLAIKPIDLLDWIRELGVKELSLERLTPHGNARLNSQIFPNNKEVDQWLFDMHQQVKEHDARNWVVNDLLESIYLKFENNFTRSGTFCRDCEEKLFTVNADGSIAGCPNSAPEQYFGHINDSIQDLLTSPKRLENIACEAHRDPRCYNCEVFSFCGGDCHQLEWQGDICGAPKTLMRSLAGINTPKLGKIIPIKAY